MNFEYSQKSLEMQQRVSDFMDAHVYPIEKEYEEFVLANPWKIYPGMEELKAKARAAGLWNLFLGKEYGHLSPGLTNLEYAPLCEIMGRIPWAPEIFNCSAPDTGNMEVFRDA